MNVLNPGPYIAWSLVMGPLLLKGWRETPSHGVALVAGFYSTMVICQAGPSYCSPRRGAWDRG